MEVLAGVALGVAVVWAPCASRLAIFSTAGEYRRFFVVAVGLLILALARLTGANDFLAAFAGGAALSSLSDEPAEAFTEFGKGSPTC